MRTTIDRTRAARAARAVGLPLFALLFAAPAAAQADPPSTRGLSLTVRVADASWAPEVRVDGGEETGGEGERGLGVGLGLGYGITPRLTAYFHGTGARVDPAEGGDTFTLAHGDLGLQYAFGGGALRPYVDVAATGRTAEVTVGGEQVEVRGGGFSFGAGVRYFVSPTLALDGRVMRTLGTLSSDDDDGEAEVEVRDAGSTRIGVGLRWYPRW